MIKESAFMMKTPKIKSNVNAINSMMDRLANVKNQMTNAR